MKKWIGGLLAALAGTVWLTLSWMSKQMLESWGGEVFKASVDRSGQVGWGIVCLLCGFWLCLIVPDDMVLENRMRVAAERKPRYDWVEFGVVYIGGLVFGMIGLAQLLGWL